MKYRIIAMNEIKPWYVLQEIYARMFREELMQSYDDPDHLKNELEILDELKFQIQSLLSSRKTGFLSSSMDIPVICRRSTKEGRENNLEVFEPNNQNIHYDFDQFELRMLEPSEIGRPAFLFYPCFAWLDKDDLQEYATPWVSIYLDRNSPYNERFEKLMREFTQEKNITLIRPPRHTIGRGSDDFFD